MMMRIGRKGQKYGLTLPKKPKAKVLLKKPAIFSMDDDEEDETVDSALLREDSIRSQRKKNRKIHDEALEQDATVFDYDGVYDAMDAARRDAKAVKEAQRKDKRPRYMQDLLAKAEERKIEQDIIKNRVEIKKLNEDGEVFQDKDVFVTQGYKEELKLRNAWLEQQKAKDMLDEARSASKHGSMMNFHSRMLDRLAGSTDTAAASTATRKAQVQEQALAAAQAKTRERLAAKEAEEAAKRAAEAEARRAARAALAKQEDRERASKAKAEPPKLEADVDSAPNTSKETPAVAIAESSLTVGDTDPNTGRLITAEDIIADIKRTKEARRKKQIEHEQREIESLKRKTTQEAAMSARERYLQRKKRRKLGQQSTNAPSSLTMVNIKLEEAGPTPMDTVPEGPEQGPEVEEQTED